MTQQSGGFAALRSELWTDRKTNTDIENGAEGREEHKHTQTHTHIHSEKQHRKYIDLIPCLNLLWTFNAVI